MNKKQFIVMADIEGSNKAEQGQLMVDFEETVKAVNEGCASLLLSPLTITLGDEFQGVTKGFSESLSILFAMEERIIRTAKTFKLRYVVVEGGIDTPINKEIAYGMMGDGLTRARRYIQHLKKSRRRFYFDIQDKPKEQAANNLYLAIETIIDDWRPGKDYPLVTSFLDYQDYKEVALNLGKERSLMWKRAKNLKISEYLALKAVANYIGGAHHV